MAPGSDRAGTDDHADLRERLIREIERRIDQVGDGDGGRRLDPKVRDALRRVPRELFVPESEQALAYANQPLPIGHRQTISQPLVVALMTHHLKLEPSCRTLEIGTGSGYQTAVLAEIATDIVTIENIPSLAKAAKVRLQSLGHCALRFLEGDGRKGAPDHAPFDRIIATAAAERVPKALVDQLAPGGRMIAPIGPPGRQQLILITKSGGADGEIRQRALFPVAFVPLTDGP